MLQGAWEGGQQRVREQRHLSSTFPAPSLAGQGLPLGKRVRLQVWHTLER